MAQILLSFAQDAPVNVCVRQPVCHEVEQRDSMFAHDHAIFTVYLKSPSFALGGSENLNVEPNPSLLSTVTIPP